MPNASDQEFSSTRWPDTPISRRHLLTRLAPLGALGVAAAACTSAPSTGRSALVSSRPLAVIYRGPAGAPGCSEAVAALLESAPSPFRTAYCGPDEHLPLTSDTLATAAIYAQPGGGGDLPAAWDAMRPFAEPLRTWIRGGGRYLGFCMGGFLAGVDPGFGILPGDSGEYTTSPGATVHDDGDASVELSWREAERTVYFQGGPYFSIPPGDAATVVARYSNGLAAAMVAPYGSGRVGVTGPHPEAPASWYRESGLTVPHPLPFDMGYDLVQTTMG